MQAIRIKVTQARLESYWYSGNIGEEYWGILEEKFDARMHYKILFEGVIPKSGNGTRWVDFEDCVVIREADITITNDDCITITESILKERK